MGPRVRMCAWFARPFNRPQQQQQPAPLGRMMAPPNNGHFRPPATILQQGPMARAPFQQRQMQQGAPPPQQHYGKTVKARTWQAME